MKDGDSSEDAATEDEKDSAEDADIRDVKYRLENSGSNKASLWIVSSFVDNLCSNLFPSHLHSPKRILICSPLVPTFLKLNAHTQILVGAFRIQLNTSGPTKPSSFNRSSALQMASQGKSSPRRTEICK